MKTSDSVFRDNLRKMAQDIEIRCRVSRDAHFLAARRWDGINAFLGIGAILIGVLGGGAAGTGILGLQNSAAAALFSAIAGILGAVISFLKPAHQVEAHKRAGDSWSILRDNFADLWELKAQHKDATEKELQQNFDSLLVKKEEVTKQSPIIPTWAYWKASDNLAKKDKVQAEAQAAKAK